MFGMAQIVDYWNLTVIKVCVRNESYYVMPYNSWADVVRLLAEQYDTRSNVKLGGFQSQLQVSYMSNHTEELWYNETVCLWMTYKTGNRMFCFFFLQVNVCFHWEYLPPPPSLYLWQLSFWYGTYGLPSHVFSWVFDDTWSTYPRTSGSFPCHPIASTWRRNRYYILSSVGVDEYSTWHMNFT